MKVSYELPRRGHTSAGEFMDKVARGVNQGYYELPKNLRSLIEWCGLEFPFLHNATISMEIKICKEILILNTQTKIKQSINFHFNDPQENNLTEFVAKKFKENIVELVTLLASGLREEVKLLEDSAALANPVTVVVL